MKSKFIKAAEHMDWQQVVLNGGPPCFNVESDGHFCGRAERWHDRDTHPYVSLADLLDNVIEDSSEPCM